MLAFLDILCHDESAFRDKFKAETGGSGMEKKNVTIYDIAREAQVSPATVSRILTGTTAVREEKRRRVMEIIEKYDFHPNAYARALTENRNKTIAMVVAHSDNSYYSSVFAACQAEAYRRGYVLLLMDTSSRPENEVSVMTRIRELRPEAMILCGGRIDLEKQDPDFTAMLQQTMQYTRIVVGSRSPLPGVPGISVDHRASMDMAVRYLAEMGHREIGFVYTGAQYYGTVERLEQFRKVMKELGLPMRKEWLIGVDDYSVDAGQEGAGKLLKLKKMPTALLGMNDMVSAGLLQGLLAGGLRVPEDISLLGFDDTFVTGITTPKLTSVGYDYQSYGAELVQTALEPETEWPQDRRIPVFVAERASCAPPSKK